MPDLISIIIPCYNQEPYLAETLESILSQTYKLWECIIVNDGSTDNTQDIALKYCEEDSRFQYLWKENSGVSDSRNFGISKSKGKYILPLDGDDLIGSEYMEKAIQAFSNDPKLKIVYCAGVFFGSYEGSIMLKPYNYKTLLLENTFFNSVFYKRIDFDCISGYSVEMKKGWEDWELLIRMLNEDSVVFKLPEVLYYYRILPNSRERSITHHDKRELFLQIYNNNKEVYDKFYPDSIYYVYLCNNLKNENLELQKTIQSIILSKKYKLAMILSKIKFLKWIF
jgi:glycosyltransferase involved in cell wall biosynthesis